MARFSALFNFASLSTTYKTGALNLWNNAPPWQPVHLKKATALIQKSTTATIALLQYYGSDLNLDTSITPINTDQTDATTSHLHVTVTSDQAITQALQNIKEIIGAEEGTEYDLLGAIERVLAGNENMTILVNDPFNNPAGDFYFEWEE